MQVELYNKFETVYTAVSNLLYVYHGTSQALNLGDVDRVKDIHTLFLPYTLNNIGIYLTAQRVPNGDYAVLKSLLNKNVANDYGHYLPEGAKDKFAICIWYVGRNITEVFESLDREYNDIKNVSLGLMESRFHKVRTYYDKERNVDTPKGVLNIVTNKTLGYAQLCKLAAVLPAVCGIKLDEPDKKLLNTETIRLLANTTENNLQVYQKHCFDYLDKIKYFSEIEFVRLRRAMEGITDTRRNAMRNNIQSVRSSIKRLEDSLASYFRQERDYLDTLNGIENMDDKTIDDTMDYFKRKQGVTIVGSTDAQLHLKLSVPAVYYDADAARRCFANPNSYVNRYRDDYLINSYIIDVLRDVFINQTLTMYFTAYVKLDLSNMSVGLKDSDASAVKDVFGIRNEHLYSFNCWGTSKEAIQQALRNSDIIAAMEQLCACVGNLNWNDSPVVSNLCISLMRRGDIRSALLDAPSIIDAEGKQWSILSLALHRKGLKEAAVAPEEAPTELHLAVDGRPTDIVGGVAARTDGARPADERDDDDEDDD